MPSIQADSHPRPPAGTLPISLHACDERSSTTPSRREAATSSPAGHAIALQTPW